MALAVAGYETAAVLLSWTWFELSVNTNSKVWASEEWDRIALFDEQVSDEGITFSLADVPRTRALVAESMRMHPPSWVLVRGVAQDLEIDDYSIPAGSLLMTSQYAMHRDDRYWSDSEKFLPERWLDNDGVFDEQAPGQPLGAWFPFGFADRKCLGDQFSLMEATLALAALGRKWHVTAVAPREVVPAAAATLRPGNGIPARIRAR
jgi:cytochrome P450